MTDVYAVGSQHQYHRYPETVADKTSKAHQLGGGFRKNRRYTRCAEQCSCIGPINNDQDKVWTSAADIRTRARGEKYG